MIFIIESQIEVLAPKDLTISGFSNTLKLKNA